jgi:hypothetical protein
MPGTPVAEPLVPSAGAADVWLLLAPPLLAGAVWLPPPADDVWLADVILAPAAAGRAADSLPFGGTIVPAGWSVAVELSAANIANAPPFTTPTNE